MSVAVDEQINYCAVHTDAEATLRCNKCDRWMCIKCAVQTPVGYRCRECIRGMEDKFFTATSADYGLTFGVTAILGVVGGFIMALVGFLLVALIAGVPFGGVVSEAARRVAGKRRGRYTAHVAAAGTALGILSPLLYTLVTRGVFVPDLAVLLFGGLAAATVYGRFAMWKK